MQTIKRALSVTFFAVILVSAAAACGRTNSPTLSGSSSKSNSGTHCVRVHNDACWGTAGSNANGGYFVPPSGR